MKKLRALIPHTAIVISNMYYVFYGIDRVNKSMDFIDNPYTKYLLAILCVLDAAVIFRLMRLRRKKRLNPRRAAAIALEAIMAILACICLVILLFDLAVGDTMIMLKEGPKLIALFLCIFSTVNAVRLVTINRRKARRRKKKNR